jgi:hypothetical protein
LAKVRKRFETTKGFDDYFFKKSGKKFAKKLAYVEKNDYLCGGESPLTDDQARRFDEKRKTPHQLSLMRGNL